MADPEAVVESLRTQARRRLIGAALLLTVGLVGFPLLFESQPRPLPVDIAIDIPSRDSVPPLRPGAAHPAREVLLKPPPPVEAGGADLSQAVETELPPRTAKTTLTPAPALVAPQASAPASAAMAIVPPLKPASAPRPSATKAPDVRPEPRVETSKAVARVPEATADGGRYVVQMGAFSEATGAREVRMKVEGLGFKTYTQVVESPAGRRIRVRVGPYATKAEADRAAAQIKAGGLPAVILVL